MKMETCSLALFERTAERRYVACVALVTLLYMVVNVSFVKFSTVTGFCAESTSRISKIENRNCVSGAEDGERVMSWLESFLKTVMGCRA